MNEESQEVPAAVSGAEVGGNHGRGTNVKQLIKAVGSAPHAGVHTPWTMYVVQDQKELELLDDLLQTEERHVVDVGIVLCGDLHVQKVLGELIPDCCNAMDHLLLMARADELSPEHTSVFPDEQRMKGVRQLLGIPQHVVPVAVAELRSKGRRHLNPSVPVNSHGRKQQQKKTHGSTEKGSS